MHVIETFRGHYTCERTVKETDCILLSRTSEVLAEEVLLYYQTLIIVSVRNFMCLGLDHLDFKPSFMFIYLLKPFSWKGWYYACIMAES